MWRGSKPYWMVMPAVAMIVLLFFGGIYEGIVQSLGWFPAAGQTDLSLDAYEHIVGMHDFWLSLRLTLHVSFISTLLAACLGLVMSICLFMMGQSGFTRWVPFWRRWFVLPMVVPHLAAAYLIVLLFTQSGWMSSLAYQLGWIEDMTQFPLWVNEPWGIGMLIAYAWKEAPFISLMIYPVLLRIHDIWQDVARVFGANSMQFVKEVVLPLLLPAWFSASFIVFAFSFSAFEVPWLLGVTYPRMLPVLAYDWYTGDLSERPYAMAVGLLLVLITALMGVVAYRLGKRWLSTAGRGWL